MDIYIGPWINYDRGSIAGATLTLDSTGGKFLIAAVSAFIVVVGGCFWTVLAFLIHQAIATEEAADALHRQHQVILRNTGGSASAALEFFQLPFSWHRKPSRQFWAQQKSPLWNLTRRSWTLALFASLSFGGWSAAGILSSQVTTAISTDLL